MKKNSIITRTSLIVIILVAVTGIMFIYTVYFRNVQNIERETRQTVEYAFDLMDNTLGLIYQQVDDLIRNISLNQEVRYYYQNNKSVDYVENAKRFSEYMDILKSANTMFAIIKLYRLDGELLYRAGSSPVELSKDILPENICEILDEHKGRQYWMQGKLGEQETVRIISYIYNFQTVRVMGILEVQIPAQSLFINQTSYLRQGTEIFLLENEENCIWQMGRQEDIDIYKLGKENGKEYYESGQYSVHCRTSKTGVGTFYLIKAQNDMKKMNGEFLLYLIGAFLVISLFIIAIAVRVFRHTLTPIVRLTELADRVEPEEGLKPLEQKEINRIKERQDEVGVLAVSFDRLLKKIEAAIANNREINRHKRKLELELLMSQIKPHFLYNTIESICGIAVLGRNEDIYQIAKNLGAFYRISLSKGDLILPVKTELEHVRSYLDIERVRSNYNFNYFVDMQEGIEEHPVLKMILQPIVENAVVHGIRGMEDNSGVISVTAQEASDGSLFFEIMDNGKGIEPEVLEKLNQGRCQADEKNGFGMYNVYERMKIYYENRCTLCYESEPGYGTKVTLCLKGQPDEKE